jgi:hypothetical protein
MQTHSLLEKLIYSSLLSIVLLVLLSSTITAEDLPPYMAPISGRTAASPAETATKNVLALNAAMFELYDNAHQIFERNILSKHPVILGLFSGAGGRFILYRPGKAALEAPSVPVEPQAMNDRLILIETISFTTSPDEMMDALTRIIADRSDGALFFGNYYQMDYELMGGDARAAIISESAKLGIKPFLPPVVPFDSKQWPMRITPGPGPGSLSDLP